MRAAIARLSLTGWTSSSRSVLASTCKPQLGHFARPCRKSDRGTRMTSLTGRTSQLSPLLAAEDELVHADTPSLRAGERRETSGARHDADRAYLIELPAVNCVRVDRS